MYDQRRNCSIEPAEDDAKDLLAVQKTLQGDTSAFSDIVNRYTPVIFSLSMRLLVHREEAEDAVQEIFLNAFKSLRQFNIESRFYSWLYTIAVNKIRSLNRNKRRSGRSVSFDTDEVPEIADRRQDIQLQVVNTTEEERIRKMLFKLKPMYRTIFVLRFIEGMSLQDTADILGVPLGTVKARLHRARKQLITMVTDE